MMLPFSSFLTSNSGSFGCFQSSGLSVTDVMGRDGSVTGAELLLLMGGDGCDPFFDSDEKF